MTLRAKLDYAICKQLCVPVDAQLELTLPDRPTAFDAALAASEARVPKRVPFGAGPPLGIVAAKRQSTSAPQGAAQVVVDVKAPAGSPVDLFVEGPDEQWSLPVPMPVADAPAGLHRFAFKLEGMPAGAAPQGAVLTYTLVSPAGSVEVAAPLD